MLDEIEALQERLKDCENALAYYGLPDTYFAIAMFGDPPHGDFFEDFEEQIEEFPEFINKPGKKAREYFRKYYTAEYK